MVFELCSARRAPWCTAMKHTILFVAANPRGTDQLALGEECSAIQHELQLTEGRDDFDFHSYWAVGVDELMRYLNQLRPTVLHFSGHGARGAPSAVLQSNSPEREVASPHGAGIFLQDRDRAHYVDHYALARMIASVKPVPRLVVLAACHSAAVADGLRDIVECVVGLNDSAADEIAREFAVGFYRALGYRRTIGEAVEQARATLHAKQLPGDIVTCHPRRGVDENQLYLSGPAAVEPRAIREPRHANEGTRSELRTVASRGVDDATRATVRAVGSGQWPAGATSQDWETHKARAAFVHSAPQPLGSGAWPAAAAPYDLFLTHPPANRATAGALHDLLQADLRVFLACRSLSSLDRREQAISSALRSSRATVLLIPHRADPAWYLSEEIIAAIELHRATSGAHRLLPVLLDASVAVPRSLGDVEPIVSTAGDLHRVAAQLRELVATLPRTEAAPPPMLSHRRAFGDHVQLYDRLCRLSDAVFEKIAAHVKIARDSFAPRTAALTERALDLAQLAALDPMLCQRLSNELDRRAPGTR